MSAPNALGTFFQTTPLDQAALVDLGDESTDARYVYLSPRLFPRDISSVAKNPERGVDYQLIGSVDGKPATIAIEGAAVSACRITDGKGSIYRISPNKQFFAGWTSVSTTESSVGQSIPMGFHLKLDSASDTKWVQVTAEDQEIGASQVLALADGWFGGSAVLRPFICEVVSNRLFILQDPQRQSMPGAITGIVEGGRVAVGNVFDFTKNNSSRAVVWEDLTPRFLEPDDKLVTSCLGCSADGSVIWGSADGRPNLWINGQPKPITDIYGKPFTGEVLWATESGHCGGTGYFIDREIAAPRRTGWIARTDTRNAMPIDVYLTEVGKMPIQERLLSVYHGRSFGNRLLLLVQIAPQFS